MNTAAKNPYEDLPKSAFWRSGVADVSPFSISELWSPKHKLSKKKKIVTAGSCFAQHIGRALAKNGYSWFDAEPAPQMFDPAISKEFNYGVFSFRTGNIYTATALKQWVYWALGKEEQPTEAWEKDGRFYDPFRPAIEPGGFSSAEEMLESRAATLAAIRRAITEGDRFVFTLGLTEGWVNTKQKYTYAMCPGTLAGTFDPAAHAFKNFSFSEIKSDLIAALRAIREENPQMSFLLTVSPVPLTATASGDHVLTATTYSKSVLRAVAGEVKEKFAYVDYFPSYEIITSPVFRGMFYEPNMRSVHPDGVSFVMRSFFEGLGATDSDGGSDSETPKAKARAGKRKKAARTPAPASEADDGENDVVCEEMMLETFGNK
ncbi:GSCFA domain-containing protein [Pseudooceanicola nanhaiensis]|uniref:GSCFA domain-containing protein n=1 Tax=Pseudooceanicola nanhaiensis TaxID=375761 RepID=UPI001CD3A58E|nr:GSCFA domain-containing protein [Pseudooceanicola nanhaiensis]MCA0922317.1 GSCFA domain-containing protein [Pseudooceanicola nanhaiensis]